MFRSRSNLPVEQRFLWTSQLRRDVTSAATRCDLFCIHPFSCHLCHLSWPHTYPVFTLFQNLRQNSKVRIKSLACWSWCALSWSASLGVRWPHSPIWAHLICVMVLQQWHHLYAQPTGPLSAPFKANVVHRDLSGKEEKEQLVKPLLSTNILFL